MTTILVPIYNAPGAVETCLASLDRCCAPDQAIVLLDDASTDERIAPLAAEFCDRPQRRMVANSSNEGFVATANRGFELTDDDVVLLNSDTIVTPGWLKALERCAASDPAIATATPFSNNAEICSFPEFCKANPVPAGPDEVAAAIARIGSARYPRIPTAVGFCMFIRREVLRRIGRFDAETFGHGYGEENDFCVRATEAGYYHVLCDDAYVVHIGGASFAPTGLKPGGEAMARLLGKHPDYERQVHEFIAQDPIAERREEILAGMRADERSALAPSGSDGLMGEAQPELEFTGERFHPECEREIWYEHLHRYVFAQDFVAGRRVLDLACGEGYGSALLSRHAAQVVGADRSRAAIDHARNRYHSNNLAFLVADAAGIPLADRSIDVVVSFETLEHLEPQEEMIAEFDRVLRDDGLLLISSPDKRTYSDERDYHNEFHVRELYRDQLETLLGKHFGAVRLLGQKLAFQSLIWDPAAARGRYSRAEMDVEDGQVDDWSLSPLYWIAVCARDAQGLKKLPADLWLFGDRAESVYRHYYHEIRKNMQAGEILAERQRRIEALERRLDAIENEQRGLFARLKDKIR